MPNERIQYLVEQISAVPNDPFGGRCLGCFRGSPVDGTCPECLWGQWEQKEKEATMTANERLFSGLTKEAALRTDPHSRVFRDITNDMVERFGGIEGFCSMWFDLFEVAKDRNPGSTAVMNHLRLFMKVFEAAGRESQVEFDASAMPQEELIRLVNGFMSKQLAIPVDAEIVDAAD